MKEKRMEGYRKAGYTNVTESNEQKFQKFMKDSGKSKFLQNWMIKDMSHPYPAVRAAEVKKWFDRQHPKCTVEKAIGSAKLDW